MIDRRVNSGELFSITALRGLAALGVVLFHVRVDLWVGWKNLQTGENVSTFWDRSVAWLSVPLPFMGSGVMLFFIISGFCVALPYVGETGRTMRWREYMIRRLLRIYPPYLATLGFCLLVELTNRTAVTKFSPAAFLATGLMFQNYTTGQVASNPSFWSLPVEVELYLLFPLVLLILKRWGNTAVLVVTGVISIAALAGYYLGAKWLVYNAAEYWVLWSSGVVLAEWFKSGRLQSPPVSILCAAIAIAGLTAAGQLQGLSAALLHFGYGFAFFVFIWWTLAHEADWAALPTALTRPLILLGTISYSLYLVHFPFFKLSGFAWIRAVGHKPVNFLIPLSFVAAAVGVGWCFYRWVESPSHQWAKRAAAWMRDKPAEESAN